MAIEVRLGFLGVRSGVFSGIALAVLALTAGCNSNDPPSPAASPKNSAAEAALGVDNAVLDFAASLKLSLSDLPYDFQVIEKVMPRYSQRNPNLSPEFWPSPRIPAALGSYSELCVPTSSAMGLGAILNLLNASSPGASSKLSTASSTSQGFWETFPPSPTSQGMEADLSARRVEALARGMLTSPTSGTPYANFQKIYRADDFFLANAGIKTLSPRFDNVLETQALSVSDLFVNILSPQTSPRQVGVPVVIYGHYYGACTTVGGVQNCTFTRKGGHAVALSGYYKSKDSKNVYFTVRDPEDPSFRKMYQIKAVPEGSKAGRAYFDMGLTQFAPGTVYRAIIEGYSAIMVPLPETSATSGSPATTSAS